MSSRTTSHTYVLGELCCVHSQTRLPPALFFLSAVGFLAGRARTWLLGHAAPGLSLLCVTYATDHGVRQPHTCTTFTTRMGPASCLNTGVPTLAVHREGKDTLSISYLIPSLIFRQVWKQFGLLKGMGEAHSPVNVALPGGKKEREQQTKSRLAEVQLTHGPQKKC